MNLSSKSVWDGKLYHIVAMAQNRVIGRNNQLPWHFSADLKHFKQRTSGQTILMGRKTFESIGRVLPNREHFVLTNKPGTAQEQVSFFNSFDEAIKNIHTEKCFIIGGASVYEQTIEKADGIYLTLIHQVFEGDTYYPEIPKTFTEKSRELLQENPKIEILFYEKSSGTEEMKQ